MTISGLTAIALAWSSVPVSEMSVPPSTLLALRGGVLMTRLLADEPRRAWPQQIPLKLVSEDGETRALTGEIGWMASRVTHESRAWGEDPRALRLRPVRPTDRFQPEETNSPLAGPRLLVSLPANANGTLLLGRKPLPIRWVDVPETMPAIRVGSPPPQGVLVLRSAPDLPGLSNPLEWWRWELIAERRGLQPPAPAFDDVLSQLAARHVTGLWRVAMTNLAAASRGVAAQCRDLLTASCRDDQQTIAAWITDALAIDQLLRILLDPELEDDARARAALTWADSQVNFFAWVQQPFGEMIDVAFANPGFRDRLAECIWSSGDQVPLGVPLPPDSVTHSVIPRSITTVGIPNAQVNILNIVIEDQIQRLPFGDAVVEVTPPGLILGPFLPTLSLAEVRAGLTPETAADRQTWLQLRRRAGQWEIYVECLLAPKTRVTSPTWSDLFRESGDLRTVEAITLSTGWSAPGVPDRRHTVSITPENGWITHDGMASDDLDIDTRVLNDRWLATMTIPESWLPPTGEPLKLSATRTHGQRPEVDTMPVPVVPWRLEVEPILLDLAAWSHGDRPRLRPSGSRR